MSQKIQKKRRLPKNVRVDEFRLLIKKVPKQDILTKIAFLLAYGSGLRISEVLMLEKENFRKKDILIENSKYGVDRIVPIPKGWKYEFLNKLPLDINRRTLQRKFKKYARESNLNPMYSFHSLRHGFATRLLENGVPINQVQLLLGHSNIATTSIYTMANPTDAIKSYEDLF